MASSDSTIQRLRAAITDGRTANIRYRQTELQNLHAALAENAAALAAAISQDTGVTSAEFETEIFLTMDSLRYFYDSLDFEKEMKEEYLVTKGEDNSGRRIGVGLVVVKPTSHTRLFSVLSPIFAAVAAGNCVLLELPQTSLGVDKVLKEILTKALDQDAFAIITSSASSLDLPSRILLDQTSTSDSSKTNELLSSTASRTIAIVDRTADIDTAAKAIVTARFSFQGTSSYAPDLVIVNEWVKRDFFEACTKYATQLFSSRSSVKASSSNASKETSKAVKEAEAKGQLSTFGSADFKIADISERNAPLTSSKISGFYLPIVQCSSITDAVFSQDTSTTFLAGYFFAEPSAAKFISQHLDCHMTFVNQIPIQLLVGPASPLTHAPSYPNRYTTEMFSLLRPQFISTPSSKSKSTLLSFDQKDNASTKEVRKQALKPLKPTGQGKGEAIGFFEQGIVTGGVILFGVVVPAMGYASWVLGRKGWELARRK